ncbi:hypothetical protein Ait01nite_054400 [Actinoplanes italicus]|uniref:Uncharacterized protein n=1 Tax=Actinoplanes italicus TaxID=113567 RepID=A0A2T0K7N2_9ACTN|nr:hypothetical protein [Actinoplanes italicus]PRX19026.1 hypothetical protein CLV67_111174 [Actinoplanes italicus]GIE32395.1 hypothetical protein Ait01nite_054400 [Actinoplanes italicus]
MADLDLILTALAAGGGAVATAMAEQTARDAYAVLKSLLRPYLRHSEAALRELDADRPDRRVIEAHLDTDAAAGDRELLAAARALLDELGHGPATSFSVGTVQGDLSTPHFRGPVTVHGDLHFGSRSGEVRPPASPATT